MKSLIASLLLAFAPLSFGAANDWIFYQSQGVGNPSTKTEITPSNSKVFQINASGSLVLATVTNAELAGGIDLTSKVAGILPEANGGTGVNSLGTGVGAALQIAPGNAGAFVLFNGAGGQPSSIDLTNGTALPPAGVVGTAAILGANTFTGIQTVTTNGAASAPPVIMTGTWFSGGSATTTKPQLLIEPTGTTSTGWSTNGTGIGVNAPNGFAGNLLDLQVNGTSHLRWSETTGGILGNDGANYFRIFLSGGQNGFVFDPSTIYISSDAGALLGAWSTATAELKMAANMVFGWGSATNSINALDSTFRRGSGAATIQTESDITFTSSSKGPILKDTQGTPHYWRISVDNTGTLTTTDLGTTPP